MFSQYRTVLPKKSFCFQELLDGWIQRHVYLRIPLVSGTVIYNCTFPFPFDAYCALYDLFGNCMYVQTSFLGYRY